MIRDTVLVTGGSGFVGRTFVRDSLGEGLKLRLLARRPTVYARSLDVVYIDDVRVDLGTWDFIMHGVGSVVHLAGRAHVTGRNKSVIDFATTNVDLSSRIAEAAYSRGVRRFVYVSSIGAVSASSAPNRPLTEDSPCNPETQYGKSKLNAEHSLREIAVRYDSELVVVRPPLVHGNGAPGNLNRIAAVIQRGYPLPLAGVHNLRSMIHVRNLSTFLRLCLEKQSAVGQTFHVRDLTDYSTPEILAGLAKSINRPLRLFHLPMPVLEFSAQIVGQRESLKQLVGWLQVDDERARRALRFTPEPFAFGFG